MGIIMSRLLQAVENMYMYMLAATNLTWRRPKRAYAIVDVAGKGKGVVATVDIPKGTRIICETPILILDQRVPNTPAYVQQLDSHIFKQMYALSVDQQLDIVSMSNIYPYKDLKEMHRGIMRTNALPCGPDLSFAGLFLQACRINHACDNNAQNFWNDNIDKLTIHAVRDIGQGEEITISYLSSSQNPQARQQELQHNFKFSCACRLCSLPSEQSKALDAKLDRIVEIDTIIEEAGTQGLVSPARRMLGYVDEQVRLWDGHTIGLARAYPDAFQLSIANGDLARARVFAGRTLQLCLIAMGDDSPDVTEYAGLVRDPTAHPYYGMSMQWKTGLKDAPQDMDLEEFENWLWKRNGRTVKKKYVKPRAGA
ncbi:hypothetical protein HBH56_155460 [Parastagonospora nodorum]|uniref:SET domain-containing protein n=2 Tax=Phaeosphaeria nodorum (strain SN15 / ATCC MYA-4574 / FGSC 10173) TaxID=321614 RepID=A0A7U2EZY9_PHANO|nr:hypothetical protein SNOG_05503 [Parastagonospora nodorum SN15]KAH3910032.1 hypothetical protein HBH56_155460 [Parastagonospora nodorum]EAT86567.1 hypothetical protein SNOG_05503 [Parastagonospora nodorum SN15]KAH3926791.1 hypothetical protein HBH54_162230 [Parastagonospora nodorum]KAH4134940.1 hypothetical protein HBH45_157180 [Parastagonospora nodorum]KAH4155157.1 hypothetical protein HBH44_143110 [Parastagonospora nodorum]